MQLKKVFLAATGILNFLFAQEPEKRPFQSKFSEENLLFNIRTIDTLCEDKEKTLNSLVPEKVCVIAKLCTIHAFSSSTRKNYFDTLRYINYHRPDVFLQAFELVISKKIVFSKIALFINAGADVEAKIPGRTYSIQELLEAKYGIRIIEGIKPLCSVWRWLVPNQECEALKNCLIFTKNLRKKNVAFHHHSE